MDEFDQHLSLRPAGITDIPVLVALNRHVQSLHGEALPELFRQDPSATEVAAAFKEKIDAPGSLWLLAESHLTACGYLYAQFREHGESWSRPARRICNIAHLAVHPDYRRKGIARALVEAVVDEAMRQGFPRVEIDVWAFNTEARKAFRQLGFEVFNERLSLARMPADKP